MADRATTTAECDARAVERVLANAHRYLDRHPDTYPTRTYTRVMTWEEWRSQHGALTHVS
jgi:hypothetical protein